MNYFHGKAFIIVSLKRAKILTGDLKLEQLF